MILVKDLGFAEDTIVLGFKNDVGEIEYTTYHRESSGNIGDPDSDIGAILADVAGIPYYIDYDLKEITDTQSDLEFNRIEIIGKDGREFSIRSDTKKYTMSVQDEGRTLKLFEKEPYE